MALCLQVARVTGTGIEHLMCALRAPTQLVSGERLGENVDISRQKHIYSKTKKLGRLLAQPLLLSVSSLDE